MRRVTWQRQLARTLAGKVARVDRPARIPPLLPGADQTIRTVIKTYKLSGPLVARVVAAWQSARMAGGH